MTERTSRRPFHRRCKCSRILLPIAAVCLSILSCGNPDPNPLHSNSENVLHFDVPSPLRSLDPLDETPSGAMSAFPLIYSQLFIVGEDGRIQPELAVKWAYDPARFAWTIQLRENAFFHNGRRVTSKDVLYSMEYLSGRRSTSYLHELERMTSLSETSLEFILKKDDPYFLSKISLVEILPEDGASRIDRSNHPVGSGPFRFSYRTGESEVGLTANDGYYLGRPSLDGIVIHYVEDRERSWARLLSGKTDIATEIYPKDYEMIRRYRDRFHFNERTVQRYSLLLYNTADPLFRDQGVRRALSQAVDTRYIVERVLRGFGVPARGPAGVNSPYGNADASPPPYDPRESRELLRDAGWTMDEEQRCFSKDGKCFDFVISIFEGYQVDRKVAEYLQLCFNDLGVRARIEALPFRELTRRYVGNNEFQAVLTEFKGAYRNPEILEKIWMQASECGSLAGCFDDPRVTELLRDASRETDPDKRRELLLEVDARIVSLQPATFLFHKTAFDVTSGRISMEQPFSYDTSHIYHLKDARIVTK